MRPDLISLFNAAGRREGEEDEEAEKEFNYEDDLMNG
jgi:hypothetical protein